MAVACLVPLAAFTSVAFSDRGIGERIDELTSETEVAPEEGGGRVFAASSSRGKYWREAFRVFDARPLEGVGAGAFAVGRLRHRTDASVTRHAHGWIPQTMADLGLVGLALTTLLFLAWVVAALSATGLLPRRLVRPEGDEPPPRRDWDARTDRARHRAARAAGVRGPVLARLDLVHPGQRRDGAARRRLRGRPRPARKSSRRSASTPFSWRPSRAARGGGARDGRNRGAPAPGRSGSRRPPTSATNDALALADERKFDQALARTHDAEDLNSLTPDPLLVRAAIDTRANRREDARRSLERAVIRFPGDPQTWYRLAAFELGTLDAPEQALETIRGVLYLDPHSRPARELFLNARARLREKTGLADPGISE